MTDTQTAVQDIVRRWQGRRDMMQAQNAQADSPLAIHQGTHVRMQDFVRELNTGSNALAKLLDIKSAEEAEALGELAMNMKAAVFGVGVNE